MNAPNETEKLAQAVLRPIQVFAGPPQAARRSVTLGLTATAIENFDRGIAKLDDLVAAGRFTAQEAQQIREVHSLLHVGLDTNDDFLELEAAKTRDFLLGTGLETPDWQKLRHTARACYHDLLGDESVTRAINAK